MSTSLILFIMNENQTNSGISPEVASFVPAGFNLVGSYLQNAFNMSSADSANSFNAIEAEKNRSFQYQMWMKNNAYNTPTAQRSRLEAAGLNPYLMLNGSTAGNAQSAPAGAQASAAPPAVMSQNPFSSSSDAIMRYFELKNMKAQSDISSIEAAKRGLILDENIRKMRSESSLNEKRKDLTHFQMENEYQNWRFNRLTMDSRIENSYLQNQLVKANCDQIIQSTANLVMDNLINSVHYQNLPAQYQMQFKMWAQNIVESLSRTAVNYAQRDFINTQSDALFGSKGYYQYLKNNLFWTTQGVKNDLKRNTYEPEQLKRIKSAFVEQLERQNDEITSKIVSNYIGSASDVINAGVNLFSAGRAKVPRPSVSYSSSKPSFKMKTDTYEYSPSNYSY